DSEISSLEARINKLKAKLEQIAQKALLKDTDTTQSLHEIRVKELKNELEQDRLIFCLRSRVSDLEDELEQISLKPDPSSNDSKIGGDAVKEISLKPDPSSNDLKTGGNAIEEVSSFSKTLSLSSHHLELKPDESKVKDVDIVSDNKVKKTGGRKSRTETVRVSDSISSTESSED
ncbi:10622_t:CDS:2, partial [Dentiscutata heterogama]